MGRILRLVAQTASDIGGTPAVHRTHLRRRALHHFLQGVNNVAVELPLGRTPTSRDYLVPRPKEASLR
jgi:hypothetical protein